MLPHSSMSKYNILSDQRLKIAANPLVVYQGTRFIRASERSISD